MADNETPRKTTAEILGSLYRGLVKESVPDGVAAEITIRAASQLLSDESLAVSADV